MPRCTGFHSVVFGLVALGAVMAQTVEAATLYVGPSETHRTLAQAFAAMKGGDTLVIRDGVYTGAENQIRYNNRPPSGTAGAYTVVRAEHAGQVVFDGALALTMLDFQGTTTMAYVEFNGLQFVRPNPSVRHTITGKSWTDHAAHHIKVRECGFQHAFYLYYVSQVLVEDCYVTGYGRYSFMAFGSDHVVFRRAVARLDAVDGGGMPISHFINYNSTDVEFQNCLALDSDDSFYSNYEGTYGGFFVRGPFDGAGGVQFYSANTHIAGSMSLNVHHGAKGAGGLTLPNLAAGTVVEDSVFWDQLRVHQGLKSGSIADDFVVRHSTFGQAVANDTSNLRQAVAGFLTASGPTGEVSDSVFTRITNAGAGSATAIRETRSAVNNAFFGNDVNVAGVTTVAGSLTGVDPLAESLRYLTRIEANSPLAGIASDGGDLGATLTKRLGADGTLHGDPGYATLTDVDLWPWPQEATVQAFFRAYGQAGPDPNRGFCAAGQTLTNYVWGYLGHTVPPLGVEASPGPGSVTIRWQAPAPQAQATLLGFRVYRVDGATSSLVQTVDDPLATAATVTGLTSGVTATFVVTAIAAQAGESGPSDEVAAVPAESEPATVLQLTANRSTPSLAGTAITWTATAAGGSAPLHYQFWRYKNGAGWTLGQAWSSSNAFTWTPGTSDGGTYRIQVWVRSQGSTATYDAWLNSPALVVTSPVAISSVTSNRTANVRCGTPITWTAAATGGSGSMQFQFARYKNGAGWTTVQGYGSSDSYTWTPNCAETGTYTIQAWARAQGSTATYDAWANSPATVVANPLSVTSVSPSVAAPALVGTSVTWTVATSGESNSLQYQFWLYSAGTGWTLLRPYGSANAAPWTPSQTGTYTVQVWVRCAGSAATYDVWANSGTFVVASANPPEQ